MLLSKGALAKVGSCPHYPYLRLEAEQDVCMSIKAVLCTGRASKARGFGGQGGDGGEGYSVLPVPLTLVPQLTVLDVCSLSYMAPHVHF